MKKILILIPFLFMPNLYADKLTTGSIGLIKPSTGVIDTTRSWADKLNGNMDILAATITVLADGTLISPSSVTKQGNTFNGANQLLKLDGSGKLPITVTIDAANLSGGASTFAPFDATKIATNSSIGFANFVSTGQADIQSYRNFRSTGEGFIQGWTQFNATAPSKIEGWQLYRSTGEQEYQGWSQFRSTGQAIIGSYNLFRASGEADIGSYRNSRSTTETDIQSYRNFRSTGETYIEGWRLFQSTFVDQTGGGGGGGVSFTTHTIEVGVAGDVTIGTGTFCPLNAGWVNDSISTWTIIDAAAFTTISSSITHMYNLMYSTGGSNPAGTFTPIDFSSYTIFRDTSYSSVTARPNNITTIYPKESLCLWCLNAASSGTAQSGWSGMKLRAWKKP